MTFHQHRAGSHGRLLLGLTLVAVATALLPASVRAAEPLPPDLALVPGDAVGFGHLQLKELWRTEAFRAFRELLQKAGPRALQVFDQRFVPAPSSIDRMTAIVLAPPQPNAEPAIVVVVATSTPFDADKVRQSALPAGQPMQARAATYYLDPQTDTALRIVNDRLLFFGSHAGVRQVLDNPPRPAGALQPAVELAMKKQMVVGLNAARLPAQARGQLPPPLQPLFDCRLLTVAIDIPTETHLDVQLHYADADQAAAGEQAAKAGIAMALQGLAMARAQLENQVAGPPGQEAANLSELPQAAAALFGLAMIGEYEAILRKLPLQRRGSDLLVSARIQAGPYTSVVALSGVSAGLLLPAVQKVRMAANRMTSTNNLKQIALALHNYHDVYRRFPPAAICNKQGKPLLSWRVAILPFLEQDHLYKQFKLDEPWDGPNNRRLLAMMPNVYAIPNISKPGETTTHYRVFTGPQAMFNLQKGQTLARITDGTSNTLMAVEAAEAVPWTKPDELVYNPEGPLPKLGGLFPGGFNAAFADGSVRFLPATLPEQTLRALITQGGGEVVDRNELDRPPAPPIRAVPVPPKD